MWKPAPITTGQAYGACSGWRAYSGSRVCDGVTRNPYARAPTPLRLNGAGHKAHRLCGVLGVMTLLREGRGCLCPSLPCRLLCRGARDVFPSHAQHANPDTRFHGGIVLVLVLCTVRCLLRCHRRRMRCACVSGICPSWSSRSGDSGEGSKRKYQSRLRPCQTLWRTSYDIRHPSPEGLSVLWVTSPPARPSVLEQMEEASSDLTQRICLKRCMMRATVSL